MIKKTFLLSVILTAITVSAQDNTNTDSIPAKNWTRGGTATLLLNQSAFSDWIAGGESNIAGNFALNYDFNYKKEDWTLDNKINIAYGLTKIKGDEVQKTDDRLEFNSLLGKKARGFWSYSAFLNFRTQMDIGEAVDINGNQGVYSHFFSPAFILLGPGMLWKKHDNLKVNFAPITSKLIIAHSEFTDTNALGVTDEFFNTSGGYFGIEANETLRYEMGLAINGYYKFDLMENISIENILNLYSNYLEDPQNIDIDYVMNLVMQVNKYISANLTFQTIYDDNAFQGFQIREVFGIGVNYGF